MSTLKLIVRAGAFALLITVAAAELRAAPAHAERQVATATAPAPAPLNLALAAPPAAPRPTALAETPRATDEDLPVATQAAPKTPWWPWVLIAAAAGGVGALVFLSSGKDPSCPDGRTCK